jgi:hypothetical protein
VSSAEPPASALGSVVVSQSPVCGPAAPTAAGGHAPRLRVSLSAPEDLEFLICPATMGASPGAWSGRYAIIAASRFKTSVEPSR